MMKIIMIGALMEIFPFVPSGFSLTALCLILMKLFIVMYDATSFFYVLETSIQLMISSLA